MIEFVAVNGHKMDVTAYEKLVAEFIAAIVVFAPGGVPKDCPFLPRLRKHVAGECDKCGGKLTGRQRRWCSDKCSLWAYREFSKHHDWADARRAALERDGQKCVKCGNQGTPLAVRAELRGESKALLSLKPDRETYPKVLSGPNDDYFVALRAWTKRRREMDERHESIHRRYQLEVNHIVPRRGGGYKRGCAHHLVNLQTLCHECHVKVTNQQNAEHRK